MLKIISGKRYNTETAQKIGGIEAPFFRSDYNWYAEDLYRTRRGTWFLHGRGHGMSPYAAAVDGGGSTGGEDIRPKTEDEIIAWMELYQDRSEIMEALLRFFPDRVEDA